MRRIVLLIILSFASFPASALAWGYEGHEVIAAIARSYLTPTAKAQVDALLATDQDSLTAHDMLSEATWADAYRGAGHKETAAWHFVDIELDHPDLKSACFGYPSPGALASQGPAQDCIVDKIDAFSKELASPSTSSAERLLALKYLLHFVGDVHQPLHASDNHDRGGNCVLLGMSGPRTVNLHSYWDTAVVQAMGSDPQAVAAKLVQTITPDELAAWRKSDPKAWAMESYEVAKARVYTIGSKPGCNNDTSPVILPPGYDEAAVQTAAVQLQKAGVRLAMVLNQALGSR